MKTCNFLKEKLSIFSLFIFISLFCRGQDAITFEEVIKIALEENLEIKIKENKFKQAENIASFGSAGLLPRIDIIGSSSGNKGVSSLEFATDEFPAIEDMDSESSSYNGNVQLSYNIFNGLASIYTLRKLNKLSDISSVEMQIEIERVILNVAKQFYDIAFLQEQLEIQKEFISISNERYDRVMVQHSFGNVSKLDLLSALVDLSGDSIQFISCITDLNNAKNVLNQTLNRDIKTNFTVVSSIDLEANLNLEDLSSKVKSNNNYIILQQYRTDLTKTDEKMNYSSFLPKVDLSAQYGYNKSESNTSLILNQDYMGFTAFLNVSWNIFDGLTRRKKLQNAKIEVESNKLQLISIQNQIEKELINVYNQYINTINLIKIGERSVAASEKFFERAQNQFYQGSITKNEFRLSQLDLSSSKSRLNKHIYNAKLAELRLYSLCGEIIK